MDEVGVAHRAVAPVRLAEPSRSVSGSLVREFPSLAVGDGQRAEASPRDGFPRGNPTGPLSPSAAPGVGQSSAAPVRVGRIVPSLPSDCHFPTSCARAVGQKEEAIPEMGCPDLGRAEQIPFRIEPERGQALHNLSEGGASVDGEESGDVLDEDKSRVNCADDTYDLGPEPAVVVRPPPGPGRTGRLAGETGRDEIHAAAPRAAVEGREIVPDRSAIQGLVFHPRHEAGRGEGFPLDIAHSSVGVSESEVESEFQSSDPGTKSQAIHVAASLTGAVTSRSG
jgi:hypothetical protein